MLVYSKLIGPTTGTPTLVTASRNISERSPDGPRTHRPVSSDLTAGPPRTPAPRPRTTA